MSKKILLADDEPDIRQLVSLRLKSGGYEVVMASDGQDTLTKVKEEKPDLIIMDLMMPKLDGYKACRLLKFDSRFKQIPVVILSARGQQEDIHLAKECGADAYFTKPFEPVSFLAKIKELIEAAPQAPG
ncbi:MAG: response regulator [Candidatus Omnitrophica bacterium]|nr:response regulator [Candidatus Omnitrophota bacterium]